MNDYRPSSFEIEKARRQLACAKEELKHWTSVVSEREGLLKDLLERR